MAIGRVLPFRDAWPRIDPKAWIAPGAIIVGDVEIGAGSSVWYNCVLRGDVERIRIGSGTNLQDGTVVHVTTGRFGAYVGDDVLIGHLAMIHGCTIQDRAFVGMSATILDNAVVESEAMVAAGSLVPPGKVIPSRQLWAGSPAKFMRDLSDEDVARNLRATRNYAEHAAAHWESLKAAGIAAD